MSTSATKRTLYEDWQQRRQSLATSSMAAEPFARAHLRVLTYLVNRYRDLPEAKQPARFPLSGGLACDDRRIVVHHHLGRGTVGGVQNRIEARDRVVSILGRMQARDSADGAEDQPDHPQPKQRSRDPARRAKWWSANVSWKPAIRAVKRGKKIDRFIQKALLRSPYLPSEVLRHLCSRMKDTTSEDRNAASLFCQCRNRSAINYGAQAWRERVAAERPTDEIRKTLEDFFRRADNRNSAAEKMREELAHENPKVRLAAIALLSEIGDLDDVGLLSDLLSLPKLDDEDPQERQALIRAMQAIAGRKR